ncbi:MAG: DUF1631 family protein [Chromatiales bacterium]
MPAPIAIFVATPGAMAGAGGTVINLKAALKALGRGGGALSADALLQSIDGALAQRPEALPEIIAELSEAYYGGALEPQTFAQLMDYARNSARAHEATGVSHLHAAKAAVLQLIEDARGPLPPPFVMQFLLHDWRRYLALVRHRCGESSEEWREAQEATAEVLWSVAPKPTNDERTQLAGSLNAIVSKLKRVMVSAGTDPATHAGFLDELARLHLSLVTPPRSARNSVAVPASESDEPGSTTVRIDVHDPRYRELLDLLQSADVDQIEL